MGQAGPWLGTCEMSLVLAERCSVAPTNHTVSGGGLGDGGGAGSEVLLYLVCQ